MWRVTVVALLFSLCVSAHITAVFDGGGTSAGADLIKDGINPWWLQNTKEVKYCIDVDTATVSATPEKIELLIQKALHYWKVQFSVQLLQSETVPLIATQTFLKTSCDKATLQFKVGMGTLKSTEKVYLPEPDKTVGLTVRTEYDPVQLVGKGFIYISSDKLKDRKLGILNGVESPWRYDGLLYWILVHELGHVFGIPHIATFPLSGISGVMAHNFADILLSKVYFQKYVLIPDGNQPEFWTGGSTWQNCGLKDDAWNWLGTTGLCVVTQNVGPEGFQLLVQNHLGIPSVYGTIKDIKFESKRVEPTVMVQLTPENLLYPNLKTAFLSAIGFRRADYSGILVANGKQRPVQFEVSEKGLKLYGINGEKILLVLNH